MTENITFTIDLEYLARHWAYVWIGFKLVVAFFITKKELKYPIWKDGIQIPRRLHQIVRAYLRHAFVNPEWGIMKIIGFIPVWLFGGKTYVDKFMPWRVATPPPFCSRCKDKGQYYEKSFMSGNAAKWVKCECVEQNPMLPDVKCVVCLDAGNVGPNRPCMHCKRRKEQKFQPQSQSQPVSANSWKVNCSACNEIFTTNDFEKTKGAQRCCNSCAKHSSAKLNDFEDLDLVKRTKEWALNKSFNDFEDLVKRTKEWALNKSDYGMKKDKS